jgi:hypothetical protein
MVRVYKKKDSAVVSAVRSANGKKGAATLDHSSSHHKAAASKSMMVECPQCGHTFSRKRKQDGAALEDNLCMSSETKRGILGQSAVGDFEKGRVYSGVLCIAACRMYVALCHNKAQKQWLQILLERIFILGLGPGQEGGGN